MSIPASHADLQPESEPWQPKCFETMSSMEHWVCLFLGDPHQKMEVSFQSPKKGPLKQDEPPNATWAMPAPFILPFPAAGTTHAQRHGLRDSFLHGPRR